MKVPFNVSVNDRYQFEVAPEDAAALDAVPSGNDQQIHVLRNGQSYQVELLGADYANRTFEVQVNGYPFKVHIKDYYERLIQQMGLHAAGAQKQNNVKAPMPGLVLQINVEEGQTVQKGDTLLILEAMKMENVLKAAHDATIKSVKVQKGVAVEKGQLLLELE